MKVKKLIEILSKEDPEMDVYIEYDYFCCVYNVENIIRVDEKQKYENPGIYLLAERSHTMDYLLGQNENEKNDNPIQGIVVHREEEETTE